jgi:hypothetical protein
MIDLNKYVFHLFRFFFEFVAFLLVSNVSFFELMCRGVEFDHVEPSLMHEFFHIQGIGIIPLKQFKDVLPTDAYKKCESKLKKTWHSFTSKAFLIICTR